MAERSGVPPWPIALGLALVIGGRVANSRLEFGMSSPWWEAAMHGSMMVTLSTFWLWPPRQPENRSEPGATAPRLGAMLALLFLILAPVVLVETGFAPTFFWLLSLTPVPIYDFLLIFPLARLFARLRLDGSIPSSTALGPCAVFFFFALVVPALVQSVRPDSPSYLRWILLVVPPFTLLLLAVYLSDRRSAKPGWWWRELAALAWQSARLPVLFLLGELGVIAAGALGAD